MWRNILFLNQNVGYRSLFFYHCSIIQSKMQMFCWSTENLDLFQCLEDVSPLIQEAFKPCVGIRFKVNAVYHKVLLFYCLWSNFSFIVNAMLS